MLTAHIDSRTQDTGVFYHLDALTAGDAVLFRRDGKPQLALITCGDAFDQSSRHYRDNIVVLAVPSREPARIMTDRVEDGDAGDRDRMLRSRTPFEADIEARFGSDDPAVLRGAFDAWGGVVYGYGRRLLPSTRTPRTSCSRSSCRHGGSRSPRGSACRWALSRAMPGAVCSGCVASSTRKGLPHDGRSARRRVRRDDGGEHQMMNHLHPDHLAALAIEPEMADADDEAHLRQCPRCRGELATLRDVSARARRAHPGEPSPAPPESVWDNVVRELSMSGDLRPEAERRRTPVWRQPWAVAAALVVAAVVTAALLLPFTSGSVVAEATLEPLAQAPHARATLVADGDERSLNVESLDLPAFDGYYELWLLTTDGQRLVSLGPIADAAQVDIPAGIDPDVYSVVDISREPPDGDPSHSTDSVLRGPLETDA